MSPASALPGASWSPARKVVAALAGLAAYAALACAAVYLSGALFLLLNKVHPGQARFGSIVRYWEHYAAEPSLRKKLQVAIAVPACGLLVLFPAALLASTRRARSLHGDARFASPAEVEKSGLVSSGPPGILVGRYRGRYLFLRGQLSVILAAPTRSGKGTGVVIPNLLNWPHSVVVLDIKGENYDITAGYRAAQGHAVFAFSPFDEQGRSHRWNPLSAVRTSARHRITDLLSIGQVLYPNDGSGNSTEAFFNDLARNLFLGLGLLLLETPELPRTIGELLRQASGKGLPLGEHLRAVIAARSRSKQPLSGECLQALQRLLWTAPNTQTSIIATFTAPLLLFTDAMVDAATSADDFSLADLRRRRMSVYVRIPPNRLANARPLLNLFFSQLVNFNTQRTPQQDPTLRYQCLLINDEFTSMGRVGILSSAAAYLSGYNLRLLTVIQAMSQLEAVYGIPEARTFATNHGLQIIFGPREQRDAEEYSAMLGHYTQRATSHGRSRSSGISGHSSRSSHESDQRRALLLPQEFKELGAERLVVIMENCKPILGEKAIYYRDKAFRARLMRPPVVPALEVKHHFAATGTRSCHDGAGQLGIEAADDLFHMFPRTGRSANAGAALHALPDAVGERPGRGLDHSGNEVAAFSRNAAMRILTTTPFLPLLGLLVSCASPPRPAHVDEALRRPANTAAAVDLQICRSDLFGTRLLAEQSQRRAGAAEAARVRLATRPADPGQPTAGNSLYSVRFEVGSSRMDIPAEHGRLLVEAARTAPLVVLRGRTDGADDSPANSRLARNRAVAVRDYLVSAGVEPSRIRATHQPAGDHVADNTEPAGRAVNRRVEIEIYRAPPVTLSRDTLR